MLIQEDGFHPTNLEVEGSQNFKNGSQLPESSDMRNGFPESLVKKRGSFQQDLLGFNKINGFNIRSVVDGSNQHPYQWVFVKTEIGFFNSNHFLEFILKLCIQGSILFIINPANGGLLGLLKMECQKWGSVFINNKGYKLLR